MFQNPSRVVGLITIDHYDVETAYGASFFRLPFEPREERLKIIRENVIPADLAQLRIDLDHVFREFTQPSA